MTRFFPVLAAMFAFLPRAGAEEPVIVKVGVAAPLTGGISHLGVGIVKAAQLAADEINSERPVRVGGRIGKIEIVAVDDAADPRTAQRQALRLVDSDVIAVIGHLNSGCSMPAAYVYAASQVAQISPASSNPRYTELGLTTANRVIGNDRRQGEVLAFFAANRLGAKTVTVLSDTTGYGEVIASAFTATAELLGLKIAARRAIPEGEQQIAASLAVVGAVA